MNRLPEICECSRPNSHKHCRVWCGKPGYSAMFEEAAKLDEAFGDSPKHLPFRISPNEELSEQQWERIQNIIRKHKGEG